MMKTARGLLVLTGWALLHAVTAVQAQAARTPTHAEARPTPKKAKAHAVFIEPFDRHDGTSPTLVVTGLEPGRKLVAGRLTFRISGATRHPLGRTSQGMLITPDHRIVQLKPFWDFDQQSASFTITQANLDRLLQKLLPGQQLMILNLASDDGTFSQSYHAFLQVPSAARQQPRND